MNTLFLLIITLHSFCASHSCQSSILTHLSIYCCRFSHRCISTSLGFVCCFHFRFFTHHELLFFLFITALQSCSFFHSYHSSLSLQHLLIFLQLHLLQLCINQCEFIVRLAFSFLQTLNIQYISHITTPHQLLGSILCPRLWWPLSSCCQSRSVIKEKKEGKSFSVSTLFSWSISSEFF